MLTNYQPPKLSESFWVTFRMMFKEEWRQNIDFAKKRHIALFPVMLALLSLIMTIGLRYLTGEVLIGANEEQQAFSWEQLKFYMHGGIFAFSLSMGSFAFIGRVMVSQRAGGKNYLLASPATQPLDLVTNYFAYFVKEVSYYVLMLLTPAVAGMACGILLEQFASLSTPLEWASLPVVLLALTTTLAEGLALSFIASALFSRGGRWSYIIPIVGIGLGLLVALQMVDIRLMIPGMLYQFSHQHWIPIISIPCSFFIAYIGAHLVPDDFEIHVTAKSELLTPVWNRLPFLGNGMLRLLVAKDLVDLWRSNTLMKMLISYTVPLLFLLLLAWLVDFASFPIPFNLLSYAPFLGFFGFQFYSWLNGMDSPDFLNGFPVTLPQLLRAKIVVYFLITTWISVIFLIVMAKVLDQMWALPAALIVMIANSIYIVSLTALLMGPRPNKAIFDTSIMAWFYIGTIVPLLSLFLISFTQGDMAIYENWGSMVSDQGLNATTAVLVEENAAGQGLRGILFVSLILTLLGISFLMMLNRRWGRRPFEN
ncbi:MAG: hypothetical protein QF807_04245 [Candidatus Thalassarchaeaceae archaeon]|nr:hypothetical protein [Candidatus Thalassarchaeaceae archaeon]MDP7043208.1 hypothetical protein [Candidatus Thalassarchaeaceae archaeon]